ncbi:MAG: nucleotide exchange factor GrpE [Synergistaceae bacterium]|jgi:molecular chaperone GrpE|nr:nucleotide exchange factor GrpE [Synergistaceae bacterium]
MPSGKNVPRAERHAQAKETPEQEEKTAPAPSEAEVAAKADGELDGLRKLLEEAKAEALDYKDEAARAKADFYNYRTRVERDRARDRTLAAEGAVGALIPVLDNLARTLQAVPDKDSQLYKGVSMVERQFSAALQGLGLEVIGTDCRFDPSLHEAVMVADVEEDSDDEKILEELHRGYKLGDKVLRAAQVKIGRKR